MKYKISDLSKLLGVSTNTIRAYEREGYIKSERDKSNYRQYSAFDIYRTAVIRLFIKCGFSHSDLKNIIDNPLETKYDICQGRLKAIDDELLKLRFLRHWLKDNIKLMDTIKEIGNGYTIMECPALRYIAYSKGSSLLSEPGRLNAVNKFMYNIAEVQLISIYKLSDISNNIYIPYGALAMKEIDIKRLDVENIISANLQYIEEYPIQKCLYACLEIPSNQMDDEEIVNREHKKFYDKCLNYMSENNMKISGDVSEFMVNILPDTSSMLVCIPFETQPIA